MTFKEFYDNLYKINKYLRLVMKGNKPQRIFYSYSSVGNFDIYNFETGEYNLENCDKYIPGQIEAVSDLIDRYKNPKESKDSQTISNDSEDKNGLTTSFHMFMSKDSQKKPNDNPFKSYTDHLAKTLLEKNKAYGDSFTQSVDDYGLKVIGIRLSDKYNRVKHLVNNGELKENDESLQDTLLDMAGYSILALKYLKEHKNDN